MSPNLVRTTRLCLIGLLLCASPSMAHFGTIIPSDDIVTQNDAKKVRLALRFLHPMEGHVMELAKPKRFGVLTEAGTTDLLPTLTEVKLKAGEGKSVSGWNAEYTVKRPGDATFFMEPQPYWEPAEDTFIIHYTKVCVNALGKEEGWDKPAGLETEIIPLTRPYGLWTGNVFTGRVLVKGQPAAGVAVEVEYLNESAPSARKIHPPSDPFITQVVTTDANGLFTYAMPRSGWWGFAALSTADWTIKRGGADKPVEIGAVYWVHTTDLR